MGYPAPEAGRRVPNITPRACAQTIAADERSDTVSQQCLDTWKTLGALRFLQLDTDAAFYGGDVLRSDR